MALFNHRQVEVIRDALKNPGRQYTIYSHQKANRVVYQTARVDLLQLGERGVLEVRKRGKQMVFVAPADLDARLKQLESQDASGGGKRDGGPELPLG